MTGRRRQIALITSNYPTAAHPSWGTFVEQLVNAIARMGIRCTVVNPLPVHQWLREKTCGRPAISRPEGVRVFHPRYLSLYSTRLGPLRNPRLTQRLFVRAARRAVGRLKSAPDVVYGHFLHAGGLAAAAIGKELRIPCFAASGESQIQDAEFAYALPELRRLTGAIAVSSTLQEFLATKIGIPRAKIGMFPNGTDLRRFFPRDRGAMRTKFGLPPDRFLVAFVGHFIERKGPLRVARAIEGLDGVAAVYVGSGPMQPKGPQTLFTGTLPHEEVPEILSAADVFVLPTLAEGSCNAVIEAMACGLPVITSVGDFNDDLVDDDVALRIDPLDVGALHAAIAALRDDPRRREAMARGALARARELDLGKRAEAIVQWMEERIRTETLQPEYELIERLPEAAAEDGNPH